MEDWTKGTVVGATMLGWMRYRSVFTKAKFAFPYLVRVKYYVEQVEYVATKIVTYSADFGDRIPEKGDTVLIIYSKEKPRRCRIDWNISVK